MTMEQQEKAFEMDLFMMCNRYLSEFDVDPVSMIDILECQRLTMLSIVAEIGQGQEDE